MALLVQKYGGSSVADVPRLRRVAERCRVGVEESRFQSGGDLIQVTVSIGAALASPEESPEDLLARADRLLYKSKAAGRNCVTADV